MSVTPTITAIAPATMAVAAGRPPRGESGVCQEEEATATGAAIARTPAGASHPEGYVSGFRRTDRTYLPSVPEVRPTLVRGVDKARARAVRGWSPCYLRPSSTRAVPADQEVNDRAFRAHRPSVRRPSDQFLALREQSIQPQTGWSGVLFSGALDGEYAFAWLAVPHAPWGALALVLAGRLRLDHWTAILGSGRG